uniref:Uncharacterized protein n=1 Tax=Daphnia galeata TaxID=27404 RepID=A0A8J2RHC9_9CRUS|nr:unnamed protein product [Daphnia galeata]
MIKSSVTMLVTLMAVTLVCMAVPKTDAKPEPRADDHQVGSVWPDNVMIISSNNERNEDDVVESNLSDVLSISTPEISVTSSDDSFITDSITAVNEESNNATTNSSIQTDDISPIENIKIEEVPIESSISISADDDEVVQNVTENVPVVEQEVKLTVDDEIVKIDVNSSTATDSKVLDTCDFNWPFPNRAHSIHHVQHQLRFQPSRHVRTDLHYERVRLRFNLRR